MSDRTAQHNGLSVGAARKKVRKGGLFLLVLIAAFAGWLAFSSFAARSNLQQAAESAQQVKNALMDGDEKAASTAADSALAHARQARDQTRSLPWLISAAVPVLGSPFKTGQQISDVVVGLTTDILGPAAEGGIELSPSRFYRDGRINLQILRRQEPQFAKLAESARRLTAQAAAVSQPAYLSAASKARSQLQNQIAELSTLLQNAALAARLAPPMLGADGQRTYLMAFQTNAEARGTGGLLGGFGILRFNNGEPTVDMLAPNTELSTASAAIDLGPEFNDQYGWANAYTDFRNSNLSSHFPYAAQIWKSMWERQSSVAVDGVLAVDPVALSYMLAATGPITMPDGETITATNVVELTESTAYIRFPTDQAARKDYLQDIAAEVVHKMTTDVKSPREFLDALGRAAGERRLAVWSAFPDEESVLEETLLANSIPDDASPYLGVVINNLAGNKMDYYLRREIEYTAEGCVGDRRRATVRVRLTNTASGEVPLPEYVGGTLGLVNGLSLNAPNGTMVTSVRLLATKGSKLEGIQTQKQSQMEKLSAIIAIERGHPSYEVQVVIPPGQSGDLYFELSEPSAAGSPQVAVQPLIDSIAPVVSVPRCKK